MPHSQIVGILNITPDSFSDGGDFFHPDAALRRFQQLIHDGADIIDIGAESTRPNATPLNAKQEWARLEAVLPSLVAQKKNTRISLDTRHAATAEQALALGVDVINDVGGLRDEAMLVLLAKHTCPIIVMHALSIPASKDVMLPDDCDVVALMRAWHHETLARASAHGIGEDRLIFDPGIGFGKTKEQSLNLLDKIIEYIDYPQNWLIGHSRKSCLRNRAEDSREMLDEATLHYSKKLMCAGIGYVRVHDVAGHKKMREALA